SIVTSNTRARGESNTWLKILAPDKPEPLKATMSRRNRNFPKHDIHFTLDLPKKIQDEMDGKPMNRLLLAEAIGLSPSSSNFRDLLSSSYKVGFTQDRESRRDLSNDHR